jgi:cobalamin 5'-phosphate synthase/cobalamin synthase
MPAGSALAAELRTAAAALAFLTRLPLGRRIDVDGRDIARSALLFPLVGAAIGAAVGGSAILADRALPPLAAAAAALTVGALLTGALHLDGLADTADALAGGSRERALEIMRDPRIGTYGAVALALDLLLKAAAVSALLERDDVLLPLLAAASLARATPVPLARILPYARPDGGVGDAFSGRVSVRAALGATALAATLAVALLGWRGAAMLAAAAVATLAFGYGYRRWLGGVTGDALGATVESTETLALLVAVALA